MQKQTAHEESCAVCVVGIRQRPILPGRHQPGTFGAEKLNFCVRDGNRWDLLAIVTGNCLDTISYPQNLILECGGLRCSLVQSNLTCIRILDQALDRLVLTTSRITAFTASTYQPCRLQGVLLTCVMGYLFLRGASRLDAFSVYPVRTSLPCYAVGTTTVAPEVRPLRSSRTRSSSSHVSYAHDG